MLADTMVVHNIWKPNTEGIDTLQQKYSEDGFANTLSLLCVERMKRGIGGMNSL